MLDFGVIDILRLSLEVVLRPAGLRDRLRDCSLLATDSLAVVVLLLVGDLAAAAFAATVAIAAVVALPGVRLLRCTVGLLLLADICGPCELAVDALLRLAALADVGVVAIATQYMQILYV